MKTILHFATGCLVLAYIIVFYVLFLMLWPVKTLELTNYNENTPIQILNTTVHRGDTLQYNLSYCKYTDLTSVVHRTFIDGQVITLTDTPGKFPKGCRNALVTTAVVPETINFGSYYLDVVVEYDLNPYRKEFIHYKTSYFTVVK